MATAASKRDSPSTGAKNSTLRKTQKENQADAIGVRIFVCPGRSPSPQQYPQHLCPKSSPLNFGAKSTWPPNSPFLRPHNLRAVLGHRLPNRRFERNEGTQVDPATSRGWRQRKVIQIPPFDASSPQRPLLPLRESKQRELRCLVVTTTGTTSTLLVQLGLTQSHRLPQNAQLRPRRPRIMTGMKMSTRRSSYCAF